VSHFRVWLFQPAPGRAKEFAAAYSGNGVWARLFKRADGFVRTRLLAPDQDGGSWLTLDEWESLAAFERFQDQHGDTYRGLDEELADLTADERFIGAFDDA
jgi:heme-degrading monooxygenase HmoA